MRGKWCGPRCGNWSKTGLSIVLTTHYLEEAEVPGRPRGGSREGPHGRVRHGERDPRAWWSGSESVARLRSVPDEVRTWPDVQSVSRDRQGCTLPRAMRKTSCDDLLAADEDLQELEVQRAGLAEAFTELTQEAGCGMKQHHAPRDAVVRAYLMEARYESVRMLRAPAFAGPFLALPALLYLLFAVLLFGDAMVKDPKAALYLFTGFLRVRRDGAGDVRLRHLDRDGARTRTAESQAGDAQAPPAACLLAKMLMAMLFVAIVMVTMIAAAPLGHLRLSARPVPGCLGGQRDGRRAFLCHGTVHRHKVHGQERAGSGEPVLFADDLSLGHFSSRCPNPCCG